MKKYYARVRFSFGVYDFYTFDFTLKENDLVLCKVKDFFQVGTLIGYVEPNELAKFKYKPIIGLINMMIDRFNEVKKMYESQKSKLEPYDYNKTYKDGDRIIHHDHVWRFDEKYQSFFTECTVEEWEKKCS